MKADYIIALHTTLGQTKAGVVHLKETLGKDNIITKEIGALTPEELDAFNKVIDVCKSKYDILGSVTIE